MNHSLSLGNHANIPFFVFVQYLLNLSIGWLKKITNESKNEIWKLSISSKCCLLFYANVAKLLQEFSWKVFSLLDLWLNA